MISLRPVEAGSVFNGMKSHLIRPEARAANVTSSRQVYAKVPGSTSGKATARASSSASVAAG